MNKKDLLAAMIAATLLEHKINQKEIESNTDLRKQTKEIGLKLKEAQLGYVDAGFTEEQAFELMLKSL